MRENKFDLEVGDWNNVMNYVNKERAEKDRHIAELEKTIESQESCIHLAGYVTEKLKQSQTALAIEKLEELLKWVDKESDGDQKYPAPILIDKINSMIKSLKGER